MTHHGPLITQSAMSFLTMTNMNITYGNVQSTTTASSLFKNVIVNLMCNDGADIKIKSDQSSLLSFLVQEQSNDVLKR